MWDERFIVVVNEEKGIEYDDIVKAVCYANAMIARELAFHEELDPGKVYAHHKCSILELTQKKDTEGWVIQPEEDSIGNMLIHVEVKILN